MNTSNILATTESVLNAQVKEIWESIYGPWEKKRPRKTRIYEELNAKKPHLDPDTKQQPRTKSGKLSIYAFKSSGSHMLPSISVVSWKGQEVKIGYNVRMTPEGRFTRQKIQMKNGKIIVHPDRQPGLVMYLDICPKNQSSPCYIEDSGLTNPFVEVYPEYYTIDETKEIRQRMRDENNKYRAVTEVHKITHPARLNHLAQAVLKTMPTQGDMDSVEYTDLLRYHLIKEAERVPDHMLVMLGAISGDGPQVIHDARMLGIIGHNNGWWWSRPQGTGATTPLPVAEMPKLDSQIDQNVWLLRQLKETAPEFYEYLEKATKMEEGDEPEDSEWPLDWFTKLDDNGKVIVTGTGKPDMRYVKTEYKDQIQG